VLDEYWAKIHAVDDHAIRASESRLREKSDPGDLDASKAREGMPPTAESAWRWGTREAEIVQVQLLGSQGQEQRNFRTGEAFTARIHYVAHQRIQHPLFGIALYRANGFHISGPNTGLAEYDIEAIEGHGYIDYVIPTLPLLKGTYLFSATIYDELGKHAFDHHHHAYTFRVTESKQIREEYGSLYIPSQWQLETLLPAEQEGTLGKITPR
jgi:lipopolysaccharide transport system ATP-binding protein